MGRLFVVLRNADDLETISSYLKANAKEIKHLAVAYVKLSQDPLEEVAVKLDRSKITRDLCTQTLAGFDFEVIEIKYNGEGLPASVCLAEAAKQRCDAVVVMGAERKPYPSISLAGSLVDESSIPVIVIKP